MVTSNVSTTPTKDTSAAFSFVPFQTTASHPLSRERCFARSGYRQPGGGPLRCGCDACSCCSIGGIMEDGWALIECDVNPCGDRSHADFLEPPRGEVRG